MAFHINIDVGNNTAGAGATQVNNVTNNFNSRFKSPLYIASIIFTALADLHRNIGIDPISEQEIDRLCLDTLRCPDPHRMKNRLKSTKDELLRDSYKWILSNEQYRC